MGRRISGNQGAHYPTKVNRVNFPTNRFNFAAIIAALKRDDASRLEDWRRQEQTTDNATDDTMTSLTPEQASTSAESADDLPSNAALLSYFQSAQFSISAAQLNQCPVDDAIEVAFAGRSNAGKSSAINVLPRRKSLRAPARHPGAHS